MLIAETESKAKREVVGLGEKLEAHWQSLAKRDEWPIFALGEIFVSRAALAELSDDEIAKSLAEHGKGRWGELDIDEWKANDFQLEIGLPVLSLFRSKGGQCFYVTTDLDESRTEIFLREECCCEVA